MDDRRYSSKAHISLTYINNGFAEARLMDGTSARIERQPNGTWIPYIKARQVWPAQKTWEEALDCLEHALAGQGVWLRRVN